MRLRSNEHPFLDFRTEVQDSVILINMALLCEILKGIKEGN